MIICGGVVGLLRGVGVGVFSLCCGDFVVVLVLLFLVLVKIMVMYGSIVVEMLKI